MTHDSKKGDNRRNVLIVGGGLSGLVLARALSKALDPSKHNLILIDPRPFVILLPAAARLVVSDVDNLEETTLVPRDRVFHHGNGTFVQAAVKSVDFGSSGAEGGKKHGSVELSTREILQFDVLVLATGSKWPGAIAFPDDADDVHAFIKERRKEFVTAKDILLVGGGPVSIELAGEIKDLWPEKPVTIIHRRLLLLNDAYPDKFRLGVEQQLKDRGIAVITNDYVENMPESWGKVQETRLVTKKGKILNPDLISQTFGLRPATSYLPSSLLNSSGFVKVLPTLQLPSHPNVFAIGDIIEWKEQKQAGKAANGHVPVVAKNVLKYLAGEKDAEDLEKSGAQYKGLPEAILLSNGKTTGMGYVDMLWGITFGGWFARLVKSDLMVSKMRAVIGY